MMPMLESREGVAMATLPAPDPCRLAKVKGRASTSRWSPNDRNGRCKGPEAEDGFWPVSRKGLAERIRAYHNNREADSAGHTVLLLVGGGIAP